MDASSPTNASSAVGKPDLPPKEPHWYDAVLFLKQSGQNDAAAKLMVWLSAQCITPLPQHTSALAELIAEHIARGKNLNDPVFGDGHARTIATICMEQGEAARLVPFFEYQVLDESDSDNPHDCLATGWECRDLARCYELLGRRSDAVRMYTNAYRELSLERDHSARSSPDAHEHQQDIEHALRAVNEKLYALR